MSLLDIGTYIALCLGGGIAVLLIAALTGVALALVTCEVILEEPMQEKARKTLFIAWLVVSLLLFVAVLFPSHDRILKVKIARIKNEMVTQQNINKGAAEIIRVVEKLECKYLGCKGSENE